MKRLSEIMENTYRNPGNGIAQGLANHLTPISNIVMNVKNLFACRLGAVVEEAEDKVSIKVSCSRFLTPEDVFRTIDECLYPGSYGGLSMRNYIISQGLNEVRLVNIGDSYVAYFCPTDLRQAQKPEKIESDILTNKQMKERRMEEAEMDTIKLTEGADDDTEIEDKTYQEMIDLLKSDNKIKAAEKLTKFVSDEIELPKEYYFKAVKDIDGEDSIALRYKYQKRRPHGKTIEMARSLMNIYGLGDEGVWVGEYEDKDKIADEVVTLIDNILKMIGAKETNDPCVWSISDNPDEKGKDDDKNNSNGDDKKDDNSTENSDKDDKTDVSGPIDNLAQ